MPPPPTDVFASRLFLGPAMRAQPDRKLVTLVREGYEAAFEEIVRRYGRPLTRYAASIVGSRSEDVAQDAFSKALLALRRDDDKEIELRPWLYRIVRNTALNDLRDRPPTAEILEEALAAGRGTEGDAEERVELQELIERLRALPERQRAAIVMREFEGLSHEEIAAALGLSGGAARQVIFRAREALRGGAGMLLPLPLLRFMLEHGAEATTAAGAGGAGGALAAGAAGGGAGAAIKAGAVAAIIAASVGTGIAIQPNHGEGGRANAATLSSDRSSEDEFASPTPASGSDDSGTPAEPGDDHGGDRNSGQGHEGADEGKDDGSSGRSGPDDNSGPGGGDNVVDTRHGGRGRDDSDNSGPGGGGENSGHGGGNDGAAVEDHHGSGTSGGSDHSGRSGGSGAEDNSGSGSGDRVGGEDNSGPGSGGSGESGGGGSGDGVSGGDDNSGPGGGGEGPSGPTEPEPVVEGGEGSGGGSEGSSGSGSSGSGSSGSGSDSSGRGGGDEPTP